MPLEITSISGSYAAFVQNLCAKVLEQQHELKNTFISPLSLYVSMTMASMGCSGQTKKDLIKALQLPKYRNEYDWHTAAGGYLMRGLKSSVYLNIRFAHRLFVLQKADIGTKFVKDVFKYYTATWESLENMPNNDAKRRFINNWVGEMTKYHIQELLPISSITEETVLAMVDAIYVKGILRQKFPKECTSTAPFYRSYGSPCEVKMMVTEGQFQVYRLPDIKSRAIKIPLGDADWDYLIILPDHPSGLRELMAYLARDNNLQKLLGAQFKRIPVRLSLPRFKIGDAPSINIKRLLCSLGASSLFHKNGSEMSGICRFPATCISDMFHKTVIEINEDGVEDPSASALFNGIPMGTPITEFCVNHPFLLTVIYNGQIPVFMGHVMQPNSW